MAEKKRRCLLVTGMHRSGTSATAGVLHSLGVGFGSKLMPADPSNERGYWEHAEIVGCHERLLAAFRSHWADPCPLPPEWWKSEVAAPFRNELADIVEREFADCTVWGIKDPRLAKLWPLWRQLARDVDCELSILIVFRNPMEVASSLARRDGLLPRQSELLWLDHVLAIEAETRELSRTFVSYADLLRDWRRTVSEVGERLSIAWPKPLAQAADSVEGLLSLDLRHHVVGDELDDPEVLSWTKRTYATLRSAAVEDAPRIRARFTRIKNEYRASRDGPCVPERFTVPYHELRLQRERLWQLESHSAELEHELRHHRKHRRTLEDNLEQSEKSRRELRMSVGELEQTVGRMAKDATELQRHAKGLEEEMKARRAEAKETASHLKKLREHVANIERQLRGQEALTTQLKAEVSEQQKHIDNLEEEIESRAAHVENLGTEARARSKYIENLEGKVSAQEKHISNLEQEIESRAAHVENLERALRGVTEQASNLENETNARALYIEDLEGKVSMLASDREKLRKRVVAVEESLERVRGSWSWRATRPFRRISARCKTMWKG